MLKAHCSKLNKMNRKKFLAVAGGTFVVAGVTYYLSSDKSNFIRADTQPIDVTKAPLTPDENEILFLASLAPSGHNAQPWFVKYLGTYHWIIGNDKSKWLMGVDPTQRETILSIGAFIQNLEYAANHLGYDCVFKLLAKNNQDEEIMEVKLSKSSSVSDFDIEKIKLRRTVRTHYMNEILKSEDVNYLTNDAPSFIKYLPNTSKEHQYLNEQTIEANKTQSYRDNAQRELADWIRFSSADARKYRDGLTMASMEITGTSAWVLRNFYNKQNVMATNFRNQNIENVKKEVAQSAGWFLITSKDDSIASLIETGKHLQRLWLKVRDKNIAIHPMTQILEEPKTNQEVNQNLGVKEPIQFILHTAYVKEYPKPVSLRRSVEAFVRV